MDRQQVGADAEAAVAREMNRRGYRVVARNARFRLGELDLVCRRDDEVVAVEVRSRRNGVSDDAIQSIQQRKRSHVRQAMELWLAGRPVDYREVRFFVASVVFGPAGPVIDLVEDAF
ncbi:MAG TPA: YraN family protein [Myxococcota bacterium]|nr:YraN family protein [Myxococcota bacterium]HQK50553.1 YraN family protein [Myxococcota bacterium]